MSDYRSQVFQLQGEKKELRTYFLARIAKLEAENKRLREAIMVHRVHCGHARRVDDSGFDRDLWHALEPDE